MKSVIIAALAAIFVFALPVQATEKPAAPKQALAADDNCKKAMDDCMKGGKSEDDCKKDAAVQAACPK